MYCLNRNEKCYGCYPPDGMCYSCIKKQKNAEAQPKLCTTCTQCLSREGQCVHCECFRCCSIRKTEEYESTPERTYLLIIDEYKNAESLFSFNKYSENKTHWSLPLAMIKKYGIMFTFNCDQPDPIKDLIVPTYNRMGHEDDTIYFEFLWETYWKQDVCISCKLYKHIERKFSEKL